VLPNKSPQGLALDDGRRSVFDPFEISKRQGRGCVELPIVDIRQPRLQLLLIWGPAVWYYWPWALKRRRWLPRCST
jgi:hypothetical protein